MVKTIAMRGLQCYYNISFIIVALQLRFLRGRKSLLFEVVMFLFAGCCQLCKIRKPIIPDIES